MTQHTHQTAPTQFVEANGIRFAYRRFGKTGGMPLVFNQHFRGTMDYWDPAVTDGLASNREVILFNNAGVSSSSGQVPASIQEMGQTPSPSSRLSCLPRSTCSAFPSAAWSLRKSQPRRRISFAGSFLSEPDRGRRYVDEQIRRDLRRRLRSAGASLACGSLLAVSIRPSRRLRLSETQASPQGSRSRGERRSGDGAARSPYQILRASRGRSQLSQGDSSADADRTGQQRRHRAYGELLHPAAESAERGADPVPQRKSRIVLSVPELFVSDADQFLSSALQDGGANLRPSERLPFPSIVSAAGT